MLPLIAAAAVAGGVKGLAGAISNRSRSRRTKLSIKDAYRRGDAQLRLQQGDVRQSTNESLASRGLLNAGGKVAAPQLEQLETPGKGLINAVKTGKRNAGIEGRNGRRLQAAQNQVGLAGTIASGVSTDLSSEFYKERDDLYSQEQDALKQNKADTMQGYVDAVSGGIQTAGSVMSAFGGGGASTTLPSGIPSAYNIDVVDPLAAFNAGQTQDVLNGANYELGIPPSGGR